MYPSRQKFDIHKHHQYRVSANCSLSKIPVLFQIRITLDFLKKLFLNWHEITRILTDTGNLHKNVHDYLQFIIRTGIATDSPETLWTGTNIAQTDPGRKSQDLGQVGTLVSWILKIPSDRLGFLGTCVQ